MSGAFLTLRKSIAVTGRGSQSQTAACRGTAVYEPDKAARL